MQQEARGTVRLRSSWACFNARAMPSMGVFISVFFWPLWSSYEAQVGSRAGRPQLPCSLGDDPHLSEVARVVLVKHDTVVVLATSITATTRVLPVLADTAMSR